MEEAKLYTCTTLEQTVPLKEFRETLVNVPLFSGYCRDCPNCGRYWSCPPFSEPSECLWDRYETIWIFGRKLLLSQELQDEEISMDEMTARSKALLHPEKERLLGELLELERQFPGSLALSAGSCEGCPPKQCARAEGKPCLPPERLRCSLESLALPASTESPPTNGFFGSALPVSAVLLGFSLFRGVWSTPCGLNSSAIAAPFPKFLSRLFGGYSGACPLPLLVCYLSSKGS